MSVTLIAVIVALVLGHLAPSLAVSVRRYGWYRDWLGWLDRQFPGDSIWRGRWGIALALIPPLLLVALVQVAIDDGLFGLGGLLFGVAALFYTWGPRDLDVDVEAVVQAGDSDRRRQAAARLSEDGEGRLDGASLVDGVFRNAMRRWFGVLFWFLLLGPFGALGYRLLVLSAAGEASERVPTATRRGARTLLAVLEWPVAQLMTLSLALVGDFDGVLGAWRSSGGSSFRPDHRFLTAAGRASVRSELAEAAADGGYTGASDLPELRDAMSLVWRCLLVWLAALALFVIAGFVG